MVLFFFSLQLEMYPCASLSSLLAFVRYTSTTVFVYISQNSKCYMLIKWLFFVDFSKNINSGLSLLELFENVTRAFETQCRKETSICRSCKSKRRRVMLLQCNRFGVFDAADTSCKDNVGCAHHCRSTEEGMHCACRYGYRLHPNGKDCIRKFSL